MEKPALALFYKTLIMWAAVEKAYFKSYINNKDPDQLVYLGSLDRVFAWLFAYNYWAMPGNI